MGQEAFCGKKPFIKNTTRSKYKVYALKKVDITIFILRHSWWVVLKTMGKIYLFLSIFMLQKNPILRSQRMMLNIDEGEIFSGKVLWKVPVRPQDSLLTWITDSLPTRP